MFNKKEVKLSKGEQAFLDSLYNLILNPEVKPEEREALVLAKNDLEKDGYLPRVVNGLIGTFRIDAINLILSQPVSDFYSKLYKTESILENLEKGAAISTALLPIWNAH